MSVDNRKTLEKGFNKGLGMINQVIYESFVVSCTSLLVEVAKNREFLGFTGNTQTSYMGGIYKNGRLVEVLQQQNWSKPPIRRKVPKGRWVRLKRPYEGSERAVKGKVDVDDKFGFETSLSFLQSYKRCPKDGFAFVITTGTEYSEYLETAVGLDVLTKTYEEAADIINSNWKKMPD